MLVSTSLQSCFKILHFTIRNPLNLQLTLPEFADDGQAFVSIVNTFAKCPLEITHLETGETRLLLPNTVEIIF